MRGTRVVAKILLPAHEAQVQSAIDAERALQGVDLNPNRLVNSTLVSSEGFAPSDLPPGYVPGGVNNAPYVQLDPLQWRQLLSDIQGMYNFQQIGFGVNTTGALVRYAEKRNYLLIQNTGITVLYVGFGSLPTAANGLQIPAGGNYEPLKVPQNDIFLASQSGTATGVIILATGQG